MDEHVVYLSDAKLAALIPPDSRWWARMRAKRVDAGVKAGVELKLGFEADDARRLAAQVRKAEDHAADTGKWYEDGTLAAGDLMFFEGRIGWHVVELEPKPGAVLFCQIPRSGGRSVVLHGSAVHMKDTGGAVPVSVTTLFSHPSAFPRIVQRVLTDGADPLWRFWRRFGQQPVADRDLETNLAELHTRVIDNEWFHASAPFLAGCAIVSGIVRGPKGTEVVVGSPLLVKRARPGF